MYPGSEVQLLETGTEIVLGTRLIDSGGGYCSQGATPAHFGIPSGVERVDVRVTLVTGGRRVEKRIEGVRPGGLPGALAARSR